MTRTLKITALALFSVVVLWACGGGGASSPSDVAKSFLGAVESNDWSSAKDYATEKGKEELDKLASVTSEAQNRKVEVKSEEVNGETATVKYTLDGGEEQTLNLKKDGDSWKVEFEKLGYGGGDGSGGGLEDLGKSLEDGLNELGEELEKGLEEGMENAEESHEGHDH